MIAFIFDMVDRRTKLSIIGCYIGDNDDDKFRVDERSSFRIDDGSMFF